MEKTPVLQTKLSVHGAASGDRAAEETLVLRYSRLVRVCARPFFLAGGDSEDLIQEGMIGLYKAIRDYHTDRAASFCDLCKYVHQSSDDYGGGSIKS